MVSRTCNHRQTALQVACRLLTIVLTACLASACAVNGGSPTSQSDEQLSDSSILSQESIPASQVLLTVRLKDRFELPQAISLDYSLENDDALQSAVGMVQRGLSGQYGDYPILLKLPAGRYQLRSLRVAGVNRNAQGSMLTRLDETFDAIDSDTRYIGRLIVSGGNHFAVRPSISWQDHYEEDSLLARSVGRALRGQEITSALVQFQGSAQSSSDNQQITIGTVGPAVLQTLADKQKPLFQKFLSAAHPRAFAIGDFGAAGFASGNQAIELSLERCGRRGSKQSCRIFAIDDAVVLDSLEPTRRSSTK